MAGNHLDQSGFMFRSDRCRAAVNTCGFAAGVHLIVGGTRADTSTQTA